MVNMDTTSPEALTSPPLASPPNSKRQKAARPGPPSKKAAQPAKFHCTVCDVRCPNEPSLQQHNTSKKHESNVSNIQRRDKHAMSSIFVSKLPKLHLITRSLEEEDKMGESGGDGEDKMGDTPDKTDVAGPAQNIMTGRENEKLRRDLMAVFGVYGKINKMIIEKKHSSYCIIEYGAPAMAQVALTEFQAGKVPLFYGKKLQIKSRKVTEIKPLAKIATHHEIDKENILALLEEAEDETEFGLGMVDNAISIPDQVKRTRTEACQRLQAQLQEVFPFHNIQLQVYGSFQTGLGLLDSDLDISLSVGPGKRLEREDLINALKEKCTGVSHVHLVPAPGHGTITRFLDGISSSMCDILFTNRLGIANTRLLSTILSHDKRLGRLIRLAIYWNKAVLGSVFAKQAIPSSYAVAVMVIHYLRQQEYLPDFFDRSLVSIYQEQDIYGLDCSYCCDLTKLPSMKGPGTVAGLLEGYWRYYGHDFSREGHVASMRGRLDKAELEANRSVEEPTQHSYISCFKASPLAVQDPFVVTHNLTHNVSLECAVLFRDLCRSSAGNMTAGRPLHLWFLEDRGGEKGPAREEEEPAGEQPSPEEEEKTPSFTASTPPHAGSKRGLEAMEH